MTRGRTLTVAPALRACLAATLAALAVAPAARADAPQLSVTVHGASNPASSYFVVPGQPGAQANAGILTIQNLTGHAIDVQLGSVDAMTTNTLGSTYEQAGDAVHGATGWLTLSTNSLHLDPNGVGNVTVGIAVPASAAPGDYLSGISVIGTNESDATSSGSNVSVGQEYRYAVGVETQLPGARSPHLALTGASVALEPSSLVFSLSARNDGNVILPNVSGHARVTQAGRLVASQTIAPGTFVTGTSIAIPVRAPGETPTPGTVYRVQAELDFAGGVANLDTQVVYGHLPKPKSTSTTGAASMPTRHTRPPSATASPHTRPHAAAAPPAPIPSVAPAHHHHRVTQSKSPPRAAATTTPASPRPRGGVGRGNVAASDSTLVRIAHALERAASVVGRRSVFPIMLIAVMVLFFLLQDRIDRRDPKLALAPVHADPQLDFL